MAIAVVALWAGEGCTAPVPVARGSHTVADESKHCSWYKTFDAELGGLYVGGVMVTCWLPTDTFDAVRL